MPSVKVEYDISEVYGLIARDVGARFGVNVEHDDIKEGPRKNYFQVLIRDLEAFEPTSE